MSDHIDTDDTPQMLAELTRDEGYRARVYDDRTGYDLHPGTRLIGHPTIGLGRSLDIDGLRQSEIRFLALNDISQYRNELNARPWYAALDPVRRRAILNMRHALGLGGLLQFVDMIAALARQDWDAAARAGLSSRWHDQEPGRSETVMEQLRTGVSTAGSLRPTV